jgi:hypothetical protein
MHGATIKIVSAQQARLNNNYKNTKLKLLKTNAAIWFNKICRDRQLKPNYINISINGRKRVRRPPCTKKDVLMHDMLPHHFNEVFY